MEHLFFQPDENDRGRSLAYHSDVLSMEWTTTPDLPDFIPPKTSWLDFAHDQVPLTESLDAYPLLLGWDINQIWNGHIGKAHHSLAALDPVSVGKRVASFLQAWLYFGLLEIVLGKKVHVSYLMRCNPEGRNTLYTRNLHFCLLAKVVYIRVKERDRKQAVQQHMGNTLLLARDWIFRLATFGFDRIKDNMDADYPGFTDLLSDITPAIVRLIEAITETMLYVFEDWPLQSLSNLHVNLAAVESRRTRLQQSGWCAFQIRLLEATTNQSTMDWLANAQIRQDTPGHEHCTPMACVRNNVDVSTYKQRHCVSNCQCAALFPDLTQVEQILEQDQLPVISVKYTNRVPQLVVTAVDKGKTGDYVAISHVWVDGLGGSTKKGLLMCQVLRVHELVVRLMGTQPEAVPKFWIDSLCIPGRSSKMHTTALIGIRDVYACASTVLVIDRLVQKCPPNASIEMLFASIYMSAWMQRMWTYEEAVLAKRLVFLLGNDAFHEYKPSTTGPSMPRTVSVVWKTLARQIYRLRVKEPNFNIGHVYLGFRFRSTNATGDEFLSVASMLRFSSHQLEMLEQVQKEERARDFWLMLRDIPADVVSLEGPKLSFPGFRWAPKTMMYPTESTLNIGTNGPKSVCTKDGLVGSYLYLRFDRLLQGCNASPHKRLFDRVIEGDHQRRNVNFIIWVEGDRSTSRLDDKGMAFRVHCDESWPSPPEAAPFDGVIIPSADNAIPKPGQMWPAVGLVRDESSEALKACSAGDTPVCKYVGRVIVERFRIEELAHDTDTALYTGAKCTVVDARAELRVSSLRIT